jgi:hypothetical protein
MDLSFLSQADTVTIKYELAKAALETARNNLDAAKQAYDDLLAQADTYGIPKAKLKKLTEDRVQALLDSGLLTGVKQEAGARPAEGKRGRKASRGDTASADSTVEAKANAATEEESENLSALDSDGDLGEARA